MARATPAALGPELAVVIPTLNEVENVGALIEKLETALSGVCWEAVFVDDDSRDGTAARLRAIGREKPYVRVLQRVGRRGLTSACLEGMMATGAPYVAVMDADLQHDESLLPKMLDRIRGGQLDVVVASRHTESGSMGEFAAARVALSNAGKRLSQMIARTDLSDPMSGFFMADRRFVEKVIRRMSGVSFKVLVDMVSSSPDTVRFAEVPYTFRNRLHGASKLDPNAMFEYLILIAHKAIHGIVPPRFVLFGAVGLVGTLIHLMVLGATVGMNGWSFHQGQVVATGAAMFSNFVLNNEITFRDRKLKKGRLLVGGLVFFFACAVGGLASLALGSWLADRGVPWLAAGGVGTVVAAVWNFGVTSSFTWPERHR